VFRALPDAEQDEMTDFVTEVCRECGNLRSVCSDPTLPWYPQRSYCYASAARDQIWRRTRKAYKHPDADAAEPHVTDGLTWGMSRHDLTPDDDFFGEQALTGGPKQPDGEHHEAAGSGEEGGGSN
jgi:hypothetical protein